MATVTTARPMSDDPPLRCPKDGARMTRLNAEGVTIDRCPVCGGVWLDLGELQALMDLKGEAKDIIEKIDSLRTQGAGGTVLPKNQWKCPRDGTLLTSVRNTEQPHIEYELCTHCGGMFFDAGELRDLSRFTLIERLRRLLPGL